MFLQSTTGGVLLLIADRPEVPCPEVEYAEEPWTEEAIDRVERLLRTSWVKWFTGNVFSTTVPGWQFFRAGEGVYQLETIPNRPSEETDQILTEILALA